MLRPFESRDRAAVRQGHSDSSPRPDPAFDASCALTKSCCRSSPCLRPADGRWLGYGATDEAFLARARIDTAKMLDVLQRAGHAFKTGQRVLDFGCGAGRMLRSLKGAVSGCEVWGADISAEDILWCKQHLDPEFNFVATMAFPHLPFEDHYFDFIYAGSVFTHINDLSQAWLLELRRVMTKSGKLYVTINDKHSIRILRETVWDDSDGMLEFTRALHSDEKYRRYAASDFGMFSLEWSEDAHVFYDVDYFCALAKPALRVLSVTPESHGYQTAVLMERA